MQIRKRLIGKIVEVCIENINEKELHLSEMIYNSILKSLGMFLDSKLDLKKNIYKMLSKIRLVKQ